DEKRRRVLADGEAQAARRQAVDLALADLWSAVADAAERRGAVLAHHPGALVPALVEREVHAEVLLGARRLAATQARRVVGRKDAADEEDGGERARAVVGDGVEVPPGVAAGAHVGVGVHERPLT